MYVPNSVVVKVFSFVISRFYFEILPSCAVLCLISSSSFPFCSSPVFCPPFCLCLFSFPESVLFRFDLVFQCLSVSSSRRSCFLVWLVAPGLLICTLLFLLCFVSLLCLGFLFLVFCIWIQAFINAAHFLLCYLSACLSCILIPFNSVKPNPLSNSIQLRNWWLISHQMCSKIYREIAWLLFR